jgi:hypothetical protein
MYLYLFLVCYVYLFISSGILLMICMFRFDCGIFSMLYMDHWEGQEFKTFEPISWSPIFHLVVYSCFAFLLFIFSSYFISSIQSIPQGLITEYRKIVAHEILSSPLNDMKTEVPDFKKQNLVWYVGLKISLFITTLL